MTRSPRSLFELNETYVRVRIFFRNWFLAQPPVKSSLFWKIEKRPGIFTRRSEDIGLLEIIRFVQVNWSKSFTGLTVVWLFAWTKSNVTIFTELTSSKSYYILYRHVIFTLWTKLGQFFDLPVNHLAAFLLHLVPFVLTLHTVISTRIVNTCAAEIIELWHSVSRYCSLFLFNSAEDCFQPFAAIILSGSDWITPN